MTKFFSLLGICHDANTVLLCNRMGRKANQSLLLYCSALPSLPGYSLFLIPSYPTSLNTHTQNPNSIFSCLNLCPRRLTSKDFVTNTLSPPGFQLNLADWMMYKQVRRREREWHWGTCSCLHPLLAMFLAVAAISYEL